SLSGPQNVATQTGQVFERLVEGWALANWVSDLPGFATPPELQYKMWRFRTDYPLLRGRCPDPRTGAPPNTGIPPSLTLVPGGGAWESLPGSTRAAGLGGAGAALVGDAGAVFSNPAGIATIRHLSVEGGYQHFAGGSAVASGALALRAGRLSWGFGAAARDTS